MDLTFQQVNGGGAGCESVLASGASQTRLLSPSFLSYDCCRQYRHGKDVDGGHRSR